MERINPNSEVALYRQLDQILRGETVDQTREANRSAVASGMNLAALFKDAARTMDGPEKE